MPSTHALLRHRLAALSLLIPAATAVAASPPAELPVQLMCSPDDLHTFVVTRDAAGAPLAVGMNIAAGARECGFSSAGPPTSRPGGAWRFDWQDDITRQRQRVDVQRIGTDGYALSFEPAACGALKIPATATLTAKGKGCAVSVDRHHAFVQFWHQLRDALARNDGMLLQRLALPQLEFVEGPDAMKAPASILRHAAACLPTVPTVDGNTDIGRILASEGQPRMDMPPVSRRGDSRVSFGGAMSLRWTPQGWRMEGFNASRSVFSQCRPAQPAK